MLVLNPNMSNSEVLDQQFGLFANLNDHLFTDFSIRCRFTPDSMLNIKESGFWSAWTHLLMINRKTVPSFDGTLRPTSPHAPRTHNITVSPYKHNVIKKAGLTHRAVCSPPSSVSVWQPAPPSWPWGWCLSVSSFIPPSGRPLAPSKSRMTASVSSRPP